MSSNGLRLRLSVIFLATLLPICAVAAKTCELTVSQLFTSNHQSSRSWEQPLINAFEAAARGEQNRHSITQLLVDQFGSNARLTFNRQSNQYFLNLLKVKEIDGTGLNNSGVFVFKESNGSHVVVKTTDNNLGGFLRELFFTYAGESVGGPRVLGFGKVEGNTKSKYYIKMTHLSGEKDSQSLKALGDRSLLASAAIFFKKYYNQKFADQLIESIAENFIRVFEKGLSPGDPDFVVSQSGKASWVDFALWNVSRSVNDPLRALSKTIIDLELVDSRLPGRLTQRILEKLEASRLSLEDKQEVTRVIKSGQYPDYMVLQRGIYSFETFGF